ncbi:MAG: hypothetical protein IJW60_01255 [Clostridia bacterium]|nr:hypothetical protein [Clostridia bacterium]
MRIVSFFRKRIADFFYRRKQKRLGLSFPLYCKAHGVKAKERQGAIAQSRAKDTLQLVHAPIERYPFNVYIYSIPLNRVLGYLDERLSKKLVNLFGDGFCVDGVIENITGENYAVRGCNLQIFETRTMLSHMRDFSHLYGE